MSGEKISDKELMSLFEAAKWAPSSANNQPWKFIYAKRESEHWQKFFDLLNSGNAEWAKNASALIVVASKTTFDFNNSFSRTHSFDSGAAWMSFALQASIKGLTAHGMEGFDYDKAKKELEIPEEYQIEAMIALGKKGKKEDLSEKNQKREFPSDRKKLSETVFEGKFRK
ncbi:nitroreductase family protein [Candidatus Micrarchaeota archaeon]|nr:nitroreductase family protein [Candidatus Micrarchaeota archaeon]